MDSLVGIFWIFVKLAAAKHTASTTSSTSILPEEEQPTKLDYVVQETLHTVDFLKKVVMALENILGKYSRGSTFFLFYFIFAERWQVQSNKRS